MRRHPRTFFKIIISMILLSGLDFGIYAALQTELPGKITAPGLAYQGPVEGQPAPDVFPYWRAFARRSAQPMAVSWNRRTGTPESIFGALSAPEREVSEIAARRFLAENAPLFKMNGDLADLILARDFESPMGRHFVFQQHYRGVQ